MTLSGASGVVHALLYWAAILCLSVSDPLIAPYVIFRDSCNGEAVLSRENATKSSIETDAAHVSAIFRTPGVFSLVSFHCSTSNWLILTILIGNLEPASCHDFCPRDKR